MKDKKIAIYYIATDDYKKLFPDFLESIHNFFPDCKKTIKLISDGLEEYKDYNKNNVKVELCPRINNYPWPIIALYKMWHIFSNFDDKYDYSCYFNANSIVNKHDLNLFDLNKITVSYHSFNSKEKKYNPWKYIDISRYSSAFLENETYEYIQSGFFFGPSKLVYKMCTDINQLIKTDMNRKLFAQWHDESYLNKWCVDNKEFVNKKYIMTVYKNDIDKERFVYLRDKRDYLIDKRKMMCE